MQRSPFIRALAMAALLLLPATAFASGAGDAPWASLGDTIIGWLEGSKGLLGIIVLAGIGLSMMLYRKGGFDAGTVTAIVGTSIFAAAPTLGPSLLGSGLMV